MRTVHSLIGGAVIILAAAACSVKEEMPSPEGVQQLSRDLKEVVITASLDTESETRTNYLLDPTDGKMHVFWTPGDSIKIFSAGESAKFISQNTEPKRITKFKGWVPFITGADDGTEIDYVWGIYPYRSDATYSEPEPGVSATAQITTTLPDVQIGKAGTFADDLAVTIGRSESLSISFKSAYSGIYVTLNRSDISMIIFKGNDGEAVAGRFTLGMKDENGVLTPEVRSIEDGDGAVVLYAPDGGTFQPGKEYYIITLPDIHFQTGFNVTLVTSAGQRGTYTVSRTGGVDFACNKINTLKNADARITEWTASDGPAPNEIWYDSWGWQEIKRFAPIEGNPLVSNTFDRSREQGRRGVLTYSKPLTQIPYRFSYRSDSLTAVFLPFTVNSIDIDAFGECNSLKDVSFGDVENIGYYAFSHADIREIVLPESLKTIGYNPFYGCEDLRFLGKNDSPDDHFLILPGEDGRKTLIAFSAREMTGCAVPDEWGIEVIGGYAFGSQNSLTTLRMPATLKEIQLAAFFNCTSLQEVTIPDSGQQITVENGTVFIGDTSLQAIYVKSPFMLASNSLQAVFLTTPLEEIVQFGAPVPTFPIYVAPDLVDDYEAFMENFASTPSRVWALEYYEGRFKALVPDTKIYYKTSDHTVFPYHTDGNTGNSVVSNTYDTDADQGVITFAKALTALDESAFSYAGAEQSAKLVSVTLPDEVRSIGTAAFRYCSSLESVILTNPRNLTAIGENAFRMNTNGTAPFGKLKKLGGSDVADGTIDLTYVTSLGKYTFWGCDAIQHVILGNLPTVTQYAFYSCSNLQDVRLLYPQVLTELGNNAFGSCKKLKTIAATPDIDAASVTLPELLTLGSSALYYTAIKSLDVPKATKIGGNALQHCFALEHLNAPEVTLVEGGSMISVSRADIFLPKLTSYTRMPFDNRLPYLHIGDRITDMKTSLFHNGSSSPAGTRFFIDAPVPPEITTSTFLNANLLVIAVPEGCIYAYRNAWREALAACGISETIITSQPNVDDTHPLSGSTGSHGWMYLGGGMTWARTNIGASDSRETGWYFAWGEGTPKASFEFYNNLGNPFVDAAGENWGRAIWRMPTKEDLLWLKDHCEFGTESDGSVIVTSKINGYSITLPPSGCMQGSQLFASHDVIIWSSTPYEFDNPEFVRPDSQAYALYVTDGVVTVAPTYRWYGYNVRPMLIENN